MDKSFGFRSFKLVLATLFAFFIISPAFASENIISNVVISNSKINKNAFELNIDSTLTVPYKVVQENDDSVYFDLKNSVLSDNVSTYYDDVTNIDNVVVKQMDKSKVRIYVEGKNAKNTELIFVNSLFESQVPKKSIVINRPINEYRSINSNNDLENQNDIQDWDDNSFNFSHLAAALLSFIKDGTLGIILIVVSLFAIITMLIKNFSNRLYGDEDEPLIGVGSLYTPKNIHDDLKNVPIQSNYLDNNLAFEKNNDFEEIQTRNETLKIAQEHLSVAHQKYQNYLQNKYQNKSTVKTSKISPVTQGIALNQYQKSNRNPYPDQEVIKIKREYIDNHTEMSEGANTIIPRRPRVEQPKQFTSPYIQKTPLKSSPQQNMISKNTNLKFLESVTKIYEQSGREDLANGLKSSISKVKQRV